MGQPIWQIRNSNLGTIAENIFFEYELEAIDTDLAPVSYSLIAGTLPEGIQLAGTSISGIPIKITGVPAEVDDDVSTQFAIRATTTTNEVSDITLDLTVSGQTVPEITTAAGSLGSYFYGDYVDIQLDAEDTDTGQTLSWSVINNTLPDGLELIVDPDDDRIAYIRGYPVPVTSLPAGVEPGYDLTAFDADLSGFGFDFGLDALDKTFEFVISITDGIGYDSATFSIFLSSTLIFYSADSEYPRVASDALEIGTEYMIQTAGAGDWTTAGAADSNVGTIFTATATTNGAADGLARDTSTIPQWLDSADAGVITADHTVSDGKIDPIIITPAQDIGSFLHDNYFTFKVDAVDFELDAVTYSISSGALPASLTIDSVTGWIYGYLDIVTATTEDFTFSVIATKVSDPTYISEPVTFTMTVTSDFASTLNILSPTTMEIDNGDISQLAIIASPDTTSSLAVDATSDNITADQSYPTVDFAASTDGTEILADNDSYTVDDIVGRADQTVTLESQPLQLVYELASGSLPAGLALTSTGLIVGRPSFAQFQLDNGETIFDLGETVWDGTASFTVRIVDVTLGVIDETVAFTIIVNPINAGAYENLYLVSGPTIEERALYNTLITNETIFPPNDLYRNGDLYFGIAPDLRFLLADGLYPATRTHYASALEKNHYTREFSFSELKIAKAENSAGTVIYELIYADVVDSLENNGVSISQQLIAGGIDTADLAERGIEQYEATVDDAETTADTITITADATVDPNTTIFLYPASIENMRNVIFNGNTFTADSIEFTADRTFPTADRTNSGIGQQNLDTLPDWMTTIQDDGRALGWIPAVPIAYCKPGDASQILFNINDSGFDLNDISFDVDRYVWDNNLTEVDINYYLELGDTEASFDGIAPNGSFVGGDSFGGTAHIAFDVITLSNGGQVLVDAVNANGDVTEFTITLIGQNSDTTFITADNLANYTIDMDTKIESNFELIQVHTTGTGTDFALTPIRQADEPDVGDELLKFPKTNILQ
jgi:hypothetical protein